MSYLDSTAILVAAREALEDAEGDLRTIAESRFEGGLYDGLAVPATTLRALDVPIAEARIVAVERHDNGYTVICNRRLVKVSLEVTIVRAATLDHKLSDDTRDTLKGLAVQDSDVIAQAFEYPGNLATTRAAVATGLVSGRLMFSDSDIAVEFEGETSARVVSVHRFTGDALISQAVA